jgi:hypothetical protein
LQVEGEAYLCAVAACGGAARHGIVHTRGEQQQRKK